MKHFSAKIYIKSTKKEKIVDKINLYKKVLSYKMYSCQKHIIIG